jgi:hypothetical protein
VGENWIHWNRNQQYALLWTRRREILFFQNTTLRQWAIESRRSGATWCSYLEGSASYLLALLSMGTRIVERVLPFQQKLPMGGICGSLRPTPRRHTGRVKAQFQGFLTPTLNASTQVQAPDVLQQRTQSTVPADCSTYFLHGTESFFRS